VSRADKGFFARHRLVTGPSGASPRSTSVAAKHRGERWAMLTAYDYSTAALLDSAGIPVLLVDDSAANVVYGYETTVPVTVDELVPLVRGVVKGARRASLTASPR
jgi:3-methyl-2-oxobutanoate hydroxymethyltransferase